jgi:hypothetical protein
LDIAPEKELKMSNPEVKPEGHPQTNNSPGSIQNNEPASPNKHEPLRTWLTAIGLFVAALALFANAYGIRELHEWNRRNFAAGMIKDWNEQSNTHKAAIENAFPRLFQNEGPIEERPPLTPAEARLIYFSTELEGSPLFGVEDFVDEVGLVSKLKTERNPLSLYLRSQFVPTTRQLLDQYEPQYKPGSELKKALVDEFNRMIAGPSLFEQERFKEISLQPETRKLFEQQSKPEKLIMLNRMLLEDAYPKEIAKSRDKHPSMWETRNHCIALLNYFEFVTAAWENQVADREIIEHSFKNTILRWYRDLYEFMVLMKNTRKYEPWPPLQRVVEHWKREGLDIRIVPPTGTFLGR